MKIKKKLWRRTMALIMAMTMLLSMAVPAMADEIAGEDTAMLYAGGAESLHYKTSDGVELTKGSVVHPSAPIYCTNDSGVRIDYYIYANGTSTKYPANTDFTADKMYHVTGISMRGLFSSEYELNLAAHKPGFRTFISNDWYCNQPIQEREIFTKGSKICFEDEKGQRLAFIVNDGSVSTIKENECYTVPGTYLISKIDAAAAGTPTIYLERHDFDFVTSDGSKLTEGSILEDQTHIYCENEDGSKISFLVINAGTARIYAANTGYVADSNHHIKEIGFDSWRKCPAIKIEGVPLNTSLSANWMSYLPDNTCVLNINMPGTHDSGMNTSAGGVTAIGAKTQSLSIREQLEAGVRYFDLRLGLTASGNVYICHGGVQSGVITPLHYEEVLATFNQFVSAHPGEVIFFTTKQETKDDLKGKDSELEKKYKVTDPSLSGKTLGELRGKVCKVYLGSSSKYDNYDAGASAKLKVIREFLGTAPEQDLTAIRKEGEARVINTSCYNAAALENAGSSAAMINPYLKAYNFQRGKYYGWFRSDYIDKDLARKIYETNFSPVTEYISDIKGFCGDKKGNDPEDLKATIQRCEDAGYTVLSTNGITNVNPNGYTMIIGYKTTIYPDLAIKDIEGSYGYSSAGPSGYTKVNIDNASQNHFSNGSSGTEFTYLYQRWDSGSRPVTGLELKVPGGSDDNQYVWTTHDNTSAKFRFTEGESGAVGLILNRADSFYTPAKKDRPLYIKDIEVLENCLPDAILEKLPDKEQLRTPHGAMPLEWQSYMATLLQLRMYFTDNCSNGYEYVSKAPGFTDDYRYAEEHYLDFIPDAQVMIRYTLTTNRNEAITNIIGGTINNPFNPLSRVSGNYKTVSCNGINLNYTRDKSAGDPITGLSYVKDSGDVKMVGSNTTYNISKTGKTTVGLHVERYTIPQSAHVHTLDIRVMSNGWTYFYCKDKNCANNQTPYGFLMPMSPYVAPVDWKHPGRLPERYLDQRTAEVLAKDNIPFDITFYEGNGTTKTFTDDADPSNDGTMPVDAGEYKERLTFIDAVEGDDDDTVWRDLTINKATWQTPVAGEGYTIEPNGDIITVWDGYQVNTSERFDGADVKTGTKIIKGGTPLLGKGLSAGDSQETVSVDGSDEVLTEAGNDVPKATPSVVEKPDAETTQTTVTEELPAAEPCEFVEAVSECAPVAAEAVEGEILPAEQTTSPDAAAASTASLTASPDASSVNAGDTLYVRRLEDKNHNVSQTSRFEVDTETPDYAICYMEQDGTEFAGTHEDGYPAFHTYGTETKLKGARKEGFVLDGWYFEPDCSGSPVTVLEATAYTGRIILYAKWKKAYNVVFGADGRWMKESTIGYTLISDAPHDDFVEVTIDNSKVAEGSYDLIDGEYTEILLAPEYLESLSEGEHAVEIVSADGKASAEFTIAVWDETLPTVYTVRLEMNGHGLQIPEQYIMEGEALGDLFVYTYGDPCEEGYTFEGWYAEPGLRDRFDIHTTVTRDMTLYAKWISNSSVPISYSGSAQTVQTKGTYSPNWFVDGSGVWRIKNSAGQVVSNAWLCDDVILANGKDVWYLLGADGAMVTAGLIQDGSGNFYSLETEHNGYFGMLRHKNGYYNCGGQQVYLEFEQQHNGAFAAVRNPEGLEKLKAIYGVDRYDIDNTNCVYTAAF